MTLRLATIALLLAACSRRSEAGPDAGAQDAAPLAVPFDAAAGTKMQDASVVLEPDAAVQAPAEPIDPDGPYRDDAGALRPGRAMGELFPVGPGPVDTRGGRLEVRELEPALSYELWLGTERLVHTDARDAKLPRQDAPIPSIEATFGAVPPYAEVLSVRWDGPGNVCNGFALTLLGLDTKGHAHLSNDVTFCGGPAPIVTKLVDKAGKTEALAIDIPEHVPNRGGAMLPAQHFTYRAGRVRRK